MSTLDTKRLIEDVARSGESAARGRMLKDAQFALHISNIRHALSMLEADDPNSVRMVESQIGESVHLLEELLSYAWVEFTQDSSRAKQAVEAAIAAATVPTPPAESHSLTDPKIREAVYNLTGGLCSYCGTALVKEGGANEQFCVEHVVPSSKGGPNHICNYVPSCRGCNNSKGDSHVLLFIQRNLPRRVVWPKDGAPL